MNKWETILAVDIEPWACRTYAANLPDARVECADIKDKMELLTPGMADVLLGGPPCPPFSKAGKREGKNDIRNCIPEFIGAVGIIHPRMFLMEQVDGILQGDALLYFGSVLNEMEALGYAVQYREMNAVSFGVPQFRNRVWTWGIRSDLYRDGARHSWPKPTHAWPPPDDCMFGASLEPGVTVGMALGLEFGSLQSHADEPVGIDRPSTTLRSGGNGHDGCCLRIIGAGSNPHFRGDVRTERDITCEPSTTIPCGDNHANAMPKVVEYHWSDAMLQKHPPASPASTIQAKYTKGCAEGLLDCSTLVIHRRRGAGFLERGGERRNTPITEPSPTINEGVGRQFHLKGLLFPDRPSNTITAGSHETGGPEPVRNWKARGWARRLLPAECLRLQSGPDCFVWPENIGVTHKYKVIGNGWASRMGAVFAERFAAVDPASRTVVDLFCGGGLGAVGWHGRYWEYLSLDSLARLQAAQDVRVTRKQMKQREEVETKLT